MVVNNVSQHLPNECYKNDTLLIYLIPEDQRNEWFYSSWQIVPITVLLPIISILGLIGNAALLIVIVRIREMQTITNFYLGNLAISDFLFLFIPLTTYLWVYFRSNGLLIVDNIRSSGLCIFEAGTRHIFFFSSISFVVLVSSERFNAICSPITYRILSHSKKRALKYVVSIWIFAVIAAFLMSLMWSQVNKFCVVWDISGTYDIFSYCNNVTLAKMYLHEIIEHVYFYLALGATVTFYTGIIYQLRQRQRSGPLSSNIAHQLKAKSTRNRVTRMVMINSLVFFLCLLPFQILNMHNYSNFPHLTEGESHTLKWIARLLEAVNSSANPIIYTAANSTYRKAFSQIFCRTVNTKSTVVNATKQDTQV